MRPLLKVLVVDDDHSLRTSTVSLLGTTGYTNVHSASDGDEALERLLVDGGYQLVVTDFNMPKMDGLQLLTAIRRSEHLRHIKVIIVSGIADPSALRTAGADAALRKPYPYEALEEMIAALFP